VQFESFSYRHADEILNSKLAIRKEVLAAIASVAETKVQAGKEGLGVKITEAFTSRGWKSEVQVAENQEHKQFFDLFKERVAVEIEFSRYEFVYRDYFRFLSAYNTDKIDAGILIIHDDSALGRVKHKAIAPSLSRVRDDFAWLRPTLTVPIWVIALK
jgi:Restriction endonuclease BglII